MTRRSGRTTRILDAARAHHNAGHTIAIVGKDKTHIRALKDAFGPHQAPERVHWIPLHGVEQRLKGLTVDFIHVDHYATDHMSTAQFRFLKSTGRWLVEPDLSGPARPAGRTPGARR